MNEGRYHTEDISGCTFLVTGGAGFIGSNITGYLLGHGAKKVRVMDNFSTGALKNIQEFKSNPSFELYDTDIRNMDECRKAVEGMDYVLHQAALGSVPRSIEDPATTNDVNITGFLNILISAKDAEVKRMIYAASSSTYGDHPSLPKTENVIGLPLSPYAVTKYVNELYAGVFSQIYNFNTIGLRYFNVFGPKQNPHGPYAAVIPLFISSALNNEKATIYGNGLQSRDFTFVENVIQANIKALFAPNIQQHEVFNIACGENISLKELWENINLICNKNLDVNYQPERQGDVKHSLAGLDKAKNLLNYHPQVSLLEGLEKTFEWYIQNKI